jgi:uncharacterized phage protein gp47/JayE
MAIEIPDNASEVEARSKADVQRELEQSNPFLKNSWLGAIVTAAANRIFDFYLQLKSAIRDSFPDTAIGDALIRWAAIWGKEQLPASRSSGKAVATGAAGSSIPVDTLLAIRGVGSYISTAAVSISDQYVDIVDLVRSGTTVTAKFASNHGLANGVSVTIAGAADSAYNGTFSITVNAADEFQYEIVGSPADEIGTSATASFTTACVPVRSGSLDPADGFGDAFNQDAGTQITLQTPLAGVDDTLTVDFNAIGGGTDAETESELQARTLDRIQNPVAHFNVSDITEKAKEVPGVTRVFVDEATPELGQVTIYFMRDNDDDPIPVGSEVQTVKDAILEIKPANTADSDVIVKAPTAVSTDYIFTALSPNTSTMQAAITASLKEFYDERTSVGENIQQEAYQSAIFNTVDTATGDVVESFSLSAPSADITIGAGEIGTLGAVTYP